MYLKPPCYINGVIDVSLIIIDKKFMANLKVFVSSTCYDLQGIRAQIRSMLVGMLYEPVMSDQSDVIYDPRIHTHTSCLREVENCDVMILIIGSRFGGEIKLMMMGQKYL